MRHSSLVCTPTLVHRLKRKSQHFSEVRIQNCQLILYHNSVFLHFTTKHITEYKGNYELVEFWTSTWVCCVEM